MKKKVLGIVLMGMMSIILLYGCGENTVSENELVESIPVETNFETKQEEIQTEESQLVETQVAETQTEGNLAANYVGEYNDQDNNEPNLEIMQTEEGNFKVQIGIFRLTSITDGVAELTGQGLEFTATDAAGNPIKGTITLEGDKATVTFTDSTWTNIANGDKYIYTKSSDTPNMWED